MSLIIPKFVHNEIHNIKQHQGDLIDSTDENAYILTLDVDCDEQKILVSDSNSEIRIYKIDYSSILMDIKAHQARITDAQFARGMNNVFFSTSEDNTIKLWDIRSKKIIFEDKASSGFNCGSMNEHYLIAGTGNNIYSWDIRNYSSKVLFNNYHNESINSLRLHPRQKKMFMSAGNDGLVCFFDISTTRSEDEAISMIFNLETPISKVDFFSENYECFYATTLTEQISTVNFASNSTYNHEFDIRERLSGISGFEINYIIDCKYSQNNLIVYAGNFEGKIAVFALDDTNLHYLTSLDGHSAIVRAVYLSSDGKFAVTAGEDSKILIWSVDKASKLASDKRRYRTISSDFQRGSPYVNNK